MSEPDFRQMGDPLNDRLPPTYGPHAAFIGWMVCTYNDWDGVIHEEPFTADAELALARSNGLNAYLFELRRATPAAGETVVDE